MSLFVDLIELGERVTNDALEFLCKADHGQDDSIWAPMDSPLIARLVELFTERGLMRLAGVREELQAWLEGHRHAPGALLPRPVAA